MTAFLIALMAVGAAYCLLRFIVWREDKTTLRFDHADQLAPEVEASPHCRTILTLNDHTFTGE